MSRPLAGTGRTVLRALAREPDAAAAFLGKLTTARGGDRRRDAFLDRLDDELADHTDLERRARRVTGMMALGLQGALLVQHAPASVADGFCASRLGETRGHTFGTLPAGVACADVIKRATMA